MDRSQDAQALRCISMFFPVMTKEKFAELSGLTEGVIQGMIEKGHLPSLKIGRHRLINVALIAHACVEAAREEAGEPKPH